MKNVFFFKWDNGKVTKIICSLVFHRIWQTFAYMTSELSYQHFISTTVQLVKMYSFQISIWFLKNDIQKIKNK